MQKIVYYIVKQTALDGKQWFVVRGISPECILDYFWEHMTEKQKEEFLIRTVEMNECNLKEEF